MSLLCWSVFSALISLITWRMAARNLGVFLEPEPASHPLPLLTVCIPARNEEANLRECLQSLLGSSYEELEVLVYNDESTDGTAGVLRQFTEADARVRAVETLALPPGWTGKQHACAAMATAARGEWLLFMDADVRLTSPEALSLVVGQAVRKDLALLSAFPRQEMGSLGEALFIPMIFFVLFSYLPIGLMRKRPDLPISAGCGQFLLIRAQAYVRCGGHAAFPSNTHDGLYLPRNVRKLGLRTDLTDISNLVVCRMYRGSAEAWRGFARNAYEALGSPTMLAVFSLVHLLGHLGAWITALLGQPLGWLGVVLQLEQRRLTARRVRQPAWTPLLQPFCLIALTAMQWWSLALTLRNRREWKGRRIRA